MFSGVGLLSGCRRAVQNAVGTVTVSLKGGDGLVPMMMGTVVIPSGDSRVVLMVVGTSTVFLRGDDRGAWMVIRIVRPQVGHTMDLTANARFPNVSFRGIVSAGWLETEKTRYIRSALRIFLARLSPRKAAMNRFETLLFLCKGIRRMLISDSPKTRREIPKTRWKGYVRNYFNMGWALRGMQFPVIFTSLVHVWYVSQSPNSCHDDKSLVFGCARSRR